MLTFNLIIPSDSGIKVPFPFDKVGVRRLILSTRANDFVLTYNDNEILITSLYQSLYEIEFNSYFGYPDASLFSIINKSSGSSAYVKIMIDNVPESPVNENYFERGKNKS